MRLEEPGQSVHVALAIIEDALALVAIPRAAPQDQVARDVLLDRGDVVEPVIGEGSQQTAPGW